MANLSVEREGIIITLIDRKPSHGITVRIQRGIFTIERDIEEDQVSKIAKWLAAR